MDTLADSEAELFAQLEAAELQLKQIEQSVAEQGSLIVKVTTRQATLRSELEKQQQRIREKTFFCGLIHDRIRELRRARFLGTPNDISQGSVMRG